jgi:hypothetical protein
MSTLARMDLLTPGWMSTLLLVVIGTTSCESTSPGGSGGAPAGLTVVTSTSGVQPDGNGYILMVDGSAQGDIGPNDSLTVKEVDPGSHAVELADIEFNCATLGQFTRTVSIESDAGAVVGYSVACDATSRSRITFVKYPDLGNAEVILTNADGSDLVSLTDSLGVMKPEMRMPSISWSPDGNRVAFTRLGGGLFATTGEGTGVVQLAPLGLSPKWSGDGQKVAFLAAEFVSQPCCWNIFVAASDGSGSGN